MRCDTFKFFKAQWGACLICYEKRFGKYQGADRKKYADFDKPLLRKAIQVFLKKLKKKNNYSFSFSAKRPISS